MARQRLECSSCQAKFPAKTLCPRCGQPTTMASAQERILWEMGQWEDSRQRVVPQKPARIVLTPSSPQVVERMARPDPRVARPAASSAQRLNGSSAPRVNGSSAMAAPIEQLDLSRNGSRAPERRPVPATPTPQPSVPARPQPQQAVPQARTAPPPVRERPTTDRQTPERQTPERQTPEKPRPPMPQRLEARPPLAARPPSPARTTPVPRPPARPAQPVQPEPEVEDVDEPEVATLDTAPLGDVLRDLADEQQVVRSRPRQEIPFEPLPTSVGAATEIRKAVEAPSTARRRLSRKERRAKAKQVKDAARRAAEDAKARAKAEDEARKRAAEQHKAAAKAAKKAAKKGTPAPVVEAAVVEAVVQHVPAPPPPAIEPEPEAAAKLSRREKKVEKLLDDIGAVEGETPTHVLDGRSRTRGATLVITGYRVLLLTRGARRRMIGWIPLEEIERINKVWRGAPTAHIEGSFERLSFQAGTPKKLEQAIQLIRDEVRAARAPGARRHHAEIIQLWCERTAEIWESDAGRLRLWIRRHPIFTLGWLGSLIPIAYFGAQRL